MQTIETYNFDPATGPRTCQDADLASKSAKCHAELILHDLKGKELLLCKRHAIQNLSHNLDQLAAVVIELATR